VPLVTYLKFGVARAWASTPCEESHIFQPPGYDNPCRQTPERGTKYSVEGRLQWRGSWRTLPARSAPWNEAGNAAQPPKIPSLHHDNWAGSSAHHREKRKTTALSPGYTTQKIASPRTRDFLDKILKILKH